MSAQNLAVKDIDDLEGLEREFFALESDSSITVEERSNGLAEIAFQHNAISTRLLDYGQKRTPFFDEIKQKLDKISAHAAEPEDFHRLRAYMTGQEW